MKLSERLQVIADEINAGETVADIGTDHGFLPLYLIEHGRSPKVIMADISSGSLKKAEENCKLFRCSGDYELRLGNGIDILDYGEVDVVTIAGMGGLLIADILDWDLKKSRSIKRYILQPRNKPGKLRNYLSAHGFHIVKESLVKEGKFLCEILTVESGKKEEGIPHLYCAEDDYPDALITFRNPLTEEYLKTRLKTEEWIYEQIIREGTHGEEQGKERFSRIVRLKQLIQTLNEAEVSDPAMIKGDNLHE